MFLLVFNAGLKICDILLQFGVLLLLPSELLDCFLPETRVQIVDNTLKKPSIVLTFGTIGGRDGRDLSLLGIVVAIGYIAAVDMVSSRIVADCYDSIIEVEQSFGSKLDRVIAVAFTNELVLIQGGRNLLQGWTISTQTDDILEEDQRLVGGI